MFFSIINYHLSIISVFYVTQAICSASRALVHRACRIFHQPKQGQAFFLYVPHSMPHVPLFCSKKFKGKSGAGMYGDVMMEPVKSL